MESHKILCFHCHQLGDHAENCRLSYMPTVAEIEPATGCVSHVKWQNDLIMNAGNTPFRMMRSDIDLFATGKSLVKDPLTNHFRWDTAGPEGDGQRRVVNSIQQVRETGIWCRSNIQHNAQHVKRPYAENRYG